MKQQIRERERMEPPLKSSHEQLELAAKMALEWFSRPFMPSLEKQVAPIRKALEEALVQSAKAEVQLGKD